jgi:hypothetical protein
MRYKIELSIDSSKLTDEQVERLGKILDGAIPDIEKAVPLKSVSVNSMLHWVQG